MERSESAEDEHLGARLIAKGWKQGVLLPALTFGVAYDPEAPDTELAGATATQLPARTDVLPHSLSISYTGKPGSKLVVISQTCDIARAPHIESTVLAMRVDIIKNTEIITKAKSSVRQFVLNEDLGYIVDARTVTTIEKAALEVIDPIVGAPNEKVERSFSRWLAARFMRASHPNRFVDAVRRPIEALLERLDKEDPEKASAFRACDLRVFPPDPTAPPYQVGLILVFPRNADERQAAAALSVVPLLREALEGLQVSAVDIWSIRREELSADDLLETDSIRSLD